MPKSCQIESFGRFFQKKRPKLLQCNFNGQNLFFKKYKVIGLRALRFDMWGPDVLAANKVESNGYRFNANIRIFNFLLPMVAKSSYVFQKSFQKK